MLGWLRKKRSQPAPLTGAPAVRRQKTYSAQSGYVYQYYYEGHRPADAATEYVFDVTADRKTSFPVSVFVEEGGVAAWNQAHGRALSGTEVYAVAKMALFQAFDERARPDLMHEPVRVRAEGVESIVSALGLD